MTNSKEKNLQYYKDNAKSFVECTINADMSEARNKFISYLSVRALILDWGCGSGRDSLAFKEAGYQIEATDASEELCQLASEKLGQEVRCEIFDELDAKEEYDGIWACASLLHLEKDYIPETFEIACKALKSGGVMYASFKYGDFEGERNGRYFTDMTEERFAKLIKRVKHLDVVEQWITSDVRPDRGEEKWLNIILRKMTI